MRTVMTSYRRPDGMRRRPRQTLGREWVKLEVLTSRGIVGMCAKKWSGWVTWDLIRACGSTRYWPDDWSYEELRTMKRKSKPGDALPATAQASMITKMWAGLPHLVEHLAVRVYDDNTVRQTGRVIMDVVGSMWRVIAKDNDTGMQLVVYMPSLDDALLSLELLLGADEAPWEPDPYARSAPSRKKNK